MSYVKHNFVNGSVLNASQLNEMDDQIALNETAATIAGNYDATTAYNIGDHAVNNGKLYVKTSGAETAEEWTPAHWTEVTVGEELTTLNESIIEIETETGLLQKTEYTLGIWQNERRFTNSGGRATDVSYAISERIAVSVGDIIEVNSVIDTKVARISKYVGQNSTSTTLLTGSSDKKVTYIVMEECEIAFSYTIANGLSVSKLRWFKPKEYTDTTFAIAKKYTDSKQIPNYLSLFKNLCCIGDSLTRGYQAEYPSGERNRDGGYPTRLSRLTRLNVYNFGYSGATPTSWLTVSKFANYDYSVFDCAFICLGRNGSLTTEEDRTNYANIISKLRTANEHMSIFCLSVPPSSVDDTVLNSTIRSIAEENACCFVDIQEDSQVSDGSYRSDGTHYYPLGYMLLADDIKNKVNKYIHDHKSDFMQLYTTSTMDADIAGIVE